MGHLALLCLRNEAAFLLEWIAHHRAVGFDHFTVFTNDCEDGTDRMLNRLAELGGVTHVPNPGPYDQRGVQFTALKAAAKRPEVRAADWILPLDIDEFVNIHTGGHRLADLHAALPEATAITLTWRLFGSSGKLHYEDAPVTESFTRCAPRVMHWPWRAAMFKTLYRNDGTYRKPGVHRPRDPDPERLDSARWYDGHGRALGRDIRTERIFSAFGQDNHGLVQLNHYPLGAMESYLLKVARGRAVHGADRLGMDYWVERNFNTETDESVNALAPARNAELARLRADQVLGPLPVRAVAWRHDRFQALMREEPMRALLGRLMMTPPSQALPARAAQLLLSHARAAQARP
jgi:hypothetical protein